ncbi:hypothetical protein BB561_005823 [Smittium simulii]|uniref:Uncharacterized protein n=1 Tax=Smittium simulii TaxID=133385 RepID=A0A2T9Y846_9FUNG|nr:hypothetical protein BB561_005823 [Smittium simulii]
MGCSNLNQKVDATLYNRNIHLAEALPTIEENFFLSPLTDKKKNEVIFSCPKRSTIKYLPLSVNDTALATAKKVDSKLQNNPEIFLMNNNIVLVHTIREFLSDLANTTLQLRITTVYREINHTAKPPQISGPDTKPIFESKSVNALVTAKNATRNTGLRRPFQRRQQATRQSYSSSGFLQAQKTQAKSTSNFDNSSLRSLNAEAFLELKAKNSISNMERAVISARESQITNFYRFQQHSMRNSRWPLFLFWIMGSFGGFNVYQAMGLLTILYALYLQIVVGRSEIWGYDFTQITRDSRKYLEILLINKYSTTSDLCTVNIKSSKFSKQTPRSNTTYLWIQPEIVDKFIMLPTLESDNTSYHKVTLGENDTNNFNPVLEDCNMVSGTTRTVYSTGISSAFKNQELENHDIDFIFCNKQRIRRRTRYHSVQQRFLECKQSKNLTESISAAQIVNYLAEIYFTNKLKTSTIKAYKFSTLGLVDSPTRITNQRIFTEFFKTLNKFSIRYLLNH